VLGPDARPVGKSTAKVLNVAFRADGERFASVHADKSLKAWNAGSGGLSWTSTSESDMFSVKFSPNGRYLVTSGENGSVLLWDAALGKRVRVFDVDRTGHAKWVCMRPDGRRVAVGVAGTIEQYDMPVELGDVGSLNMAQSGDVFRMARDVWANQLGHQPATLRASQLRALQNGVAGGISYSPDGKLIASGCDDHSVRVWDADAGIQLLTLSGHAGKVSCVSFSPAGEILASASHDQSVKLWDAKTGSERKTLYGHASPITSMEFSEPVFKWIIGAWRSAGTSNESCGCRSVFRSFPAAARSLC
jgi:WD40 repeat protein